MKRLTVILGSIFLVGALAYPVFAWGPGWGRGHHMGYGGGPGYCWNSTPGGYESLNPEQTEALDELGRTFYEETAELRSKLWSKRGELETLFNSPETDVEEAKETQQELNELRNQLAQKRLEHELAVRKVAPSANYRRGYGAGSRAFPGGYGPRHMGYARGHMGYGPGACWY